MSDHTYFSTPGVASVRWDEANQTVRVDWEGWANSAEFHALLDAEVRALEENEGSRLLADCRLQRVLNPADQDRANREWIPRAARAGLKQFAVVLPMSDLAAANIRDRTSQIPDTAFEVAYFTTVEEAIDWLHRKAG